MRAVVVFDTNILFSALGWKGRPHECLELARSGQVIGVTCGPLLAELAEKLQTKLSFTPEQAGAAVAELRTLFAGGCRARPSGSGGLRSRR